AIQPIFVNTDSLWAEKRLGRERIQLAYPLKRVVEMGIKVAGSSDCPVASAAPFLGIYFAVSPKDLEGKELPDWVRKERIGIKERIEKEMSKNGLGLVQVRGLKLFVDGSFGASSGALYEPYINDPKNYGLLRILPEKLNNLAKQADKRGMQLSIHVIGDRALTYALDALSRTRNGFLRHRVEHI
ncbi:unnamed protein product, partial [marine sediment metagenome]